MDIRFPYFCYASDFYGYIKSYLPILISSRVSLEKRSTILVTVPAGCTWSQTLSMSGCPRQNTFKMSTLLLLVSDACSRSLISRLNFSESWWFRTTCGNYHKIIVEKSKKNFSSGKCFSVLNENISSRSKYTSPLPWCHHWRLLIFLFNLLIYLPIYTT